MEAGKPGTIKNIRFNRLFRAGIEVLVFAALVAVTTLLLQPLQTVMHNKLTALRDELIHKGEVFFNRKIEYASAGFAVFSIIDIRNVKVSGEDGEPVLAAARLRVSYSLWKLIRLDFDGLLESAQFDEPSIKLDFKRDGDLIALFSGEKDAEKGGTFRLPRSLKLKIRNGEAEILKDGTVFRIGELFFNGGIRDGRISFDTRWETSASLDAGIFGQNIAGAMTSRINGDFSTDLENGNAVIRIPSLSSDLFRVKPIVFSLVAEAGKIDLRKINDRLPFDFSFEYDRASASFSGMLECEGFLPEELFSFEGSWRNFNRWLGTSISGSASLVKDTGGLPGYKLDLYGTVPSYLNSGPIAYKVSARGDGGSITFDDLSMNISRGRFRYQGGLDFKPLLPWGSLTLSNVSLSGTEAVSGTIGIESHENTISLSGKNLALGKTTIPKLDLRFLYDDEGINFSLVMEDSQGLIPETPGRIDMEASLDFNPRHFEASISVDEFLLFNFIEMARPFVPAPMLPGIPEFASQGIGITTEVFFTTNFEHILYNAPGFKLSLRDRGLEIYASLSGTDNRFELNKGRINWQEGEADVTCFVDFSNPLDIIFSLDASYADLSYHFEGTVFDKHSLTIQGSYGLDVKVSAAEEGNYSGFIEVGRLPVPFRNRMIQVGVKSSFRFDSPQSWFAGIDSLDILNIPGPVSPVNIGIKGEADQDGLVFRELFYDDGLGALTGDFSLSWDETFSDYTTRLNLHNRSGTESCGLEGSFIGKHLEMNIHSSGMQLNRLLKDVQNSSLNAEARVRWDSRDNFNAEIAVSSLSARVNDANLNFSLNASLSADEFLLEGLDIRYEALEALLPSLRINRPEGRADTAVRIKGNVGGREIDAGLNLKADFTPIASWFDIREAVDSFNGELTVEDIRFAEIRAPEPFSFYFSYADSLVSLEGGPQNMLRLQVLDGGDFYAGLSNPSPVRGSIIGNIGGNSIEAESSDLYVDLKALWNFVPPNDIIRLEGGYATGALRVEGPLGDPEFFGIVRGHSVKIGIPNYLREPIKPVPFDVTINGNEMNFKPTPARVGNGTGTVAGSFKFDRWIPNIFNLDIKVEPGTPIPFGFDIAGVIASGDVSGNMVIAMENMNLSITGDLVAQDTEISLNTNELNFIDSDTPKKRSSVGTVIDIGIKTGKKVEFLWPSAELPILQAYADMGTGLRISNDSLSRRYALLGDVRLRSGEIFYFERSFYLREGTLFFNENQLKFDPRISARAEIRDRSDEGPVTISLIIDNSPLKSFTARFESNPPLSQLEIFSLLGQNMAGSASDEGKQPIERAIINSTADALMQFQVIRRMEREIRNFLNMDMFSIRTQVLQNAVLQATGLRDSVDRTNRVGNYFDNTTVFLGKYIGSNMFIQSMFTLRYDENKTEWAGLTLEPDIGVELQSPLFDIRMNLVPLHPENLYVSDLSFTLMWRWSF
jgi:hypothetical protein